MITIIIKSFGFAWAGIRYAFATQVHFRFHCLAMVLAVGLGFFFGVSRLEWLAIILCIVLVLSAELFNTAIESVVDLVSPAYHQLAKVAKDTAAGAVLVLAIGSAIVGLLIFLPYLL